MPDSPSPDHDQRLKVLLKEFFEQFFQCFFPKWAGRFDFTDITWLVSPQREQGPTTYP